MSSARAAWCKFKGFSKDHRKNFSGILKENPALMEEYFSAIEPRMLDYEMGTSMELDSPPESSEDRKSLLTRIATHSKGLFDALYELDFAGTENELEQLMFKSGFPDYKFHELKDPLMFLHAVAAHAAGKPSGKEPGRPPDVVTYYFIWTCFRKFEQVFGRKPRYTKGTKFQNFLKAVSSVVVRSQVALRGDLTKRVEAAISYMSKKP